MEKDYSEYTLSETQKYMLRRRGNKNLTLDYFNNTAHFDAEEKTIRISVDPYREDVFNEEDIRMVEAQDAARYEIHPKVLTPKEEAEYEQMRLDDLEENKKDLAVLFARYRVDRSYHDGRLNEFYEYEEREKRAPLHNVLSGAEVILRYGEGILDFIYADFLPGFQSGMHLFEVAHALGELVHEEYPDRLKLEAPSEPEKVYNREQEVVDEYFRYQSTRAYTKEMTYASLYTAICPPVFASDHAAKEALKRYANYLLDLQKEYREMVEFCFDEDYYPEILRQLYTSERYCLYRRLHDIPAFFRRTEKVSFERRRRNGQTMPYGMGIEELKNRLGNIPEPTQEHRHFAEQYGLDVKELTAMTSLPEFLHIDYEFQTTAEILELEFTKMLEANVRFRKCGRCGRYFIMKGNYDTRYCDRVAPGETRTCQDLAAQENYRSKNADNKAIPIYSKYYKRYAARVRVKQIGPEDFKRWKYQAITKRDECTDGKLTPEELTAWMETAFPNRKKKTH